MNTLDYIKNKFGIGDQKSPIEIPNVGRKHLARWFGELKFRRGAEIGVEAGLYSEILFQANPGLELWGVDAWAHLPHRYWVPQRRIDRYYREMLERLSAFDMRLVKKLSMDAVKDFGDGFFDFVYIDADHRYEATLEDLTEWSKKVRPGGVVAGHDYINRKGDTTHKVVQAVNKFVKDNSISPWFILGTKSKGPGEFRDDSRSYMWVKQ